MSGIECFLSLNELLGLLSRADVLFAAGEHPRDAVPNIIEPKSLVQMALLSRPYLHCRMAPNQHPGTNVPAMTSLHAARRTP